MYTTWHIVTCLTEHSSAFEDATKLLECTQAHTAATRKMLLQRFASLAWTLCLCLLAPLILAITAKQSHARRLSYTIPLMLSAVRMPAASYHSNRNLCGFCTICTVQQHVQSIFLQRSDSNELQPRVCLQVTCGMCAWRG